MSEFAVTYRKIAKVWKHPDADRLDLAEVEGSTYQFVVGRDQFKVGDDVLYFPVDSLLPQPLVEKLGLAGKLSGKDKNRIKTVRLRGQISQGICAKPETVAGLYGEGELAKCLGDLSVDLTPFFGITKYEPPVIPCHAANLRGIPENVGVYDIEGADNHPEVVAALMDQKVYVTEKMEGTNFWIDARPGEGFDGIRILLGQHHHSIEPIEGFKHEFWATVEGTSLVDNVRLAAQIAVKGGHPSATFRGELCGPRWQKNIYGLKENRIFLFDMMIGHEYLPPREFVDCCLVGKLDAVPVLAIDITLREWLAGRTIREASTGKSTFGDFLREGIVIKPMVEQRHNKVGRLTIKQRSPEYLAKSEM